MARDREFELRDGVLFDNHNVQDTAAHCWARNLVLQGRAATANAAAEKLIAEALQEVQQGITSGQMFQVYNAWCVVDAVTPGTKGMIAGVPFPAEARWEANFFVRLGRSPALREVSDS